MTTALPCARWSSFLADRGIDLVSAEVTRLRGGEINETWKIAARGTAWVLRHYQLTQDPDEVDCELAAVDCLSRSGFPTPAPVASDRGRLWDWVAGQPAAVFAFVDGNHPPQRDGGYGSLDLDVGVRAARLAGRMHVTLTGRQLDGQRNPHRDPWRQITTFLSSPTAHHPLFEGLIGRLQTLHDRLRGIYGQPAAADLPVGFIHNDLTPSNLLQDSNGEITALLDFDDSAQTYLAYELGTVVGAFGRDHHRRLDPRRSAALVTAYDAARRLTPSEAKLLPDLVATHAAAEGLSVLTNWMLAGRDVTDPLASHSIQAFLDIADDHDSIRNALSPR